MSDDVTVNVCILLQHELQAASAALAEFYDKCMDESIPRKDRQALMYQALCTSYVALKGADTATILTLGTRKTPKQTEATPMTEGNP